MEQGASKMRTGKRGADRRATRREERAAQEERDAAEVWARIDAAESEDRWAWSAMTLADSVDRANAARFGMVVINRADLS